MDNWFNDFFGQVIDSSDENKLDRLYGNSNISEYMKLVTELKSKGNKVYRNSNGKHKVVRNNG